MNLRTQSVPAQIFRVACLGCRGHVEFPLFRGGGFYAFGTYRGVKTSTYYRVDLDRIWYQKVNLDEELKSVAAAREAGVPLEHVPDELTCPACGVRVGLNEDALRTLPPPPEVMLEAMVF